ncbi:MAG: hypothetical protein ACOYXR_09345 [Nitrospirota bacterium]
MDADDFVREQAPAKLGKLNALLERSGIDPEDISRVERVNVWQGFLKNEEGQAEIVDLAGISLVPRWADGPEWPVVQPGPPLRVPAVRSTTLMPGWQTCVVLPDIQIGYFRNRSGDLEPTHDEAAITAALQIVRAAKPSLLVLVGDNLDLPEFGKYRLTPAFQQTTQATVDRATLLCGQLRKAAPEARIVWLAGNHEERLPNYVLDNARAAFGLRRGLTPESWPVLSVPYLCRMDDQAVEYVPGYPASHHWITPRLKVIHGDLVRSQASTATAYLGREKTSVIFGHVHRREYAARTRDDHDGPREVMAASPGCLARVDGAVPSTKGGTDLDGRPVHRAEDWQQGLAVVTYDPDDGRFAYEQVAIHDGWAMWRGKHYGQ